MSILKALEEFLREVGEQQAAQQARQRGAPAPARPRRDQAGRPRPPSEPVVEAEVLDAEPVPLREGVSQHVSQHLDPSSIRRHTAQLGSEVVEDEAKHEAERREKFAHKVGRLPSGKPAGTGGAPVASQVTNLAATTRAGDLAQLLRNPANIRQAIMLNEILNRPEHRW